MTVRNLRALATALLLGTAGVAGVTLVSTVPAAAAVRAAIGKPLNEAVAALKAGNYATAKAKLAEAEGMSGKTAEETQIINQIKNAIAVQSGDTSTAIGAKAKFANDYNAHKYKDVIADGDALRKTGALDASSMQIIAQAYYQDGNKQGCVNYIKKNFSSPGDTTLELLVRCAYDAQDDETQRSALETLVAHTGKPDYWSSLLKLSQSAQGLKDRDTLDIYRLKLLTGTISGKEEYTTLAEMALQLGYPAEAQNVLQKAVAAKVIQPNDRLVGFADKQVAADQAAMAQNLAKANAAPQGDALVKIGVDQWGQGKAKDAIGTIQAGMKKPLSDKNDATIRLGMAYLGAGQKADAVKTFDSVKGPAGDKQAMIAHLWSLYARR